MGARESHEVGGGEVFGGEDAEGFVKTEGRVDEIRLDGVGGGLEAVASPGGDGDARTAGLKSQNRLLQQERRYQHKTQFPGTETPAFSSPIPQLQTLPAFHLPDHSSPFRFL